MKYTTLHGGDIDSIERELGIDRKNIIDFSANINPLGVSERVKKEIAKNLDCISTYPDFGYMRLKKAIADYTSAKEENILVGNGSTELLGLTIRCLKPKKALILAPCYSEYEREVRLSGGECSYFALREDEDFVPNIDRLISEIHSDNEIDMLIICNPNNPTDSVFKTADIAILSEQCRSKGIFIMIDETYAEFVSDIEHISSIPLADRLDNIAVIRGTSKFFACPGLRLGYGVLSSPELKQKLADLKDPWSVGSLTAKAGEVMFSDKEHIEKTVSLISSERERLKKLISEIKGLKAYGFCSNLVLCKITRDGVSASDVFDSLIKYGAVIRNCGNIHGLGENYFRFCIMNPWQNDILIKGLKEIL